MRHRLMDLLSKVPGVEHVHVVASALEATRAIRSGWPDAVIVDIDMPRGAGPRILDALRAERPRILSVVLADDATEQKRDACLQAGAHFFFDKSLEVSNMVDVISRLARGDAQRLDVPPCWTCFDQLPVPSFLYEPDSLAIKAVNNAAVDRYRYSREEFLTMTLVDIQLCDGRRERHGHQASGVAGPMSGRRQHRDRDGAIIHVDVALTSMNSECGQLGVALVHDIGDRLQIELALGHLTGAVTGDLEHLLTEITGRSGEMISRLTPDDPMCADAVGIYEASVAFARRIRKALDPPAETFWRI